MTQAQQPEALRELAEAVKAWSNCDKHWSLPDGEFGEFVVGAIEDKERFALFTIDADTYGTDGESIKLAQFYAAANPAAVLALLDRNAELEADIAHKDSYAEQLGRDLAKADAEIRLHKQQEASIGAGGVEPLRKRECLRQIAEPAAVAVPDDAEPLHITHGPLMRHAAYLLRSRKPVLPEHESVAAELERAADGHPTPSGEPSPEWLEVARIAAAPQPPVAAPEPVATVQRLVGAPSIVWRHRDIAMLPDGTSLYTHPAPQPAPVAQGDAQDAARLDMLDQAHAGCIRLDNVAGLAPTYLYWGPHHDVNTARSAIDAARSRAKEGGA